LCGEYAVVGMFEECAKGPPIKVLPVVGQVWGFKTRENTFHLSITQVDNWGGWIYSVEKNAHPYYSDNPSKRGWDPRNITLLYEPKFYPWVPPLTQQARLAQAGLKLVGDLPQPTRVSKASLITNDP